MKSSLQIFAAPQIGGLTPFDVALRCRHLPGLIFFDSALAGDGALSIVAASPSEIVSGESPEDWEKLRDCISSRRSPCEADDGMPLGFAAGCVEYNGRFCFGIYDQLLIYRHADKTWHSIGNLVAQMRADAHAGSCDALRFTPTVLREQFCGMVQKAKDYIAAGDIYQVNLSHRFVSPWRGDPLGFYAALRQCSAAPYAAYLALGGRAAISSSPESFLRMSGSQIVTRPIKGTRPRRIGPAADEESAFDLISSPKEIAELVMITDLERNDLGTVCEYGSVRVRELLKLERFEQVFHLVSTVEGTLRSDVDHVSALRSCFPGGSITGVPKKRAREIIAGLEPAPRGLYTGAIGYFGFNGESQFNIAIRTVVIEGDRAHFHVGAGIVADSIPEMEYQETLDKAAGILLAADRIKH